ncbi:MAG: flagellar M-ring protein FliF [Aquabacterium sp.]|nr:MAG: flagellar M-ring protein FliF [Aquabacterium sp.]
MFIREFWGQLAPRARTGFVVGLLAIVAALAWAAYALLHTSYQPVLRASNADKLAAAVRELERQKLPYRVSGDGSTLEVPAEHAGRARVAVSGGGGGAGAAAGFELFNNTDFSTTEFTQKVNYQRALQGELARTIATIEGVSSARVHLVLPESGFLRRQPVRATAAVTVEMESGQQLGAAQVRGVQKLVAAAVPEIRLEDIAVIDHSGVPLTTQRAAQVDGTTNSRLELKREVDSYLEAKLRKLLAQYDPLGEFSVSVDATLNLDEVKVTTEDVLPADGKNAAGRSTGVVIRERQNSRLEGSAAASEAATGQPAAPGSSNLVREVEYKVGHRVEQVATAPGGIERISVAVVGRPLAGGADVASVKSIVLHAVGADEARGDSVAVIFLPALQEQQEAVVPAVPKLLPPAGTPRAAAQPPEPAQAPVQRLAWGLLAAAGVVAVLGALALLLRRNDEAPPAAPAANVDAVADRIRAWLNEEAAPNGTH